MIVDSHNNSSASQRKTSGRRVAYSLAAGAVAAGASAHADAAVVYSGLQNISINQFNGLNLDLDAFGATPDVKLKNYVFSGNYMGATVLTAPGQLVLSNASFPFYVSALTSGELI